MTKKSKFWISYTCPFKKQSIESLNEFFSSVIRIVENVMMACKPQMI